MENFGNQHNWQIMKSFDRINGLSFLLHRFKLGENEREDGEVSIIPILYNKYPVIETQKILMID